MKYTSWDRSDRKNPKLVIEGGPEVIGTFTETSADVDGDFWRLSSDPKLGASATASDDRVFRIVGNLSRDHRLEAALDGRTFSFLNESGKNWIITNVNDQKVAQFSGANQGVRAAILEFSADDLDLSREEVAALSYFARLIMQARVKSSSIAIIATLVLASLVALGALFL